MPDWYTATTAPAQGSSGSSATIRNEYVAIQTAMDKLPALSGNGDRVIKVNAAGTALEGVAQLGVPQGGTGVATLTDGGILLGSGVGAITPMARLSTGQIPVGQAAGDPAALTAFTATNLLTHEVGGIEADISAIQDGGIVVGTSTGGMAIRASVFTAGAAGFLRHEVGGIEANISAITTDEFLVGTSAGTIGIRTPTQARAHLALGSLATLSTINNSNWSGTDLAVANGGTGASDASNARTNLGLTIGTEIQAFSAVLQNTTASYTTAEETKLAGIETAATADQTNAEIKTAYEANADTNAYTDAEQTKVGHISVSQAVNLDTMESDIAALDAAIVLQGTWDASAGTFPGGGTAQAGASYIVSVAGTVDSVAFALNDRIVAITDNASTSVFASNWHKLDYTDEVLSVAGRTGAITLTLSDITDSGSLAALSSVNNANWSGTDLAVTNGGTGSSTASDARTALGVAIGSDVQAFDAGLTSIAGLTTVADRGIYATASDTYATFVLTAAGRALMDDAAASNQRTTLGLGALAVLGTINNGNWSGTDLAVVNGGTGAGDAGTARTNLGLAIGSDVHGFNADFAGLLGPGYTEEYNDIGDRGVATNVTFSTAHVQRIRLTASLTITFNGEPTSGLFGSMILVIDRSGNFTPTLAYGGGAGVTPQGAALNFTNTTNSIDVISVFTVDGGTTFYVAPYIMNAS